MSTGLQIAFFGPERTDARSVKRIAALSAEGWRVLGFTFHRDRGQPDPEPGWENIHLGNTYNRKYVHRAWAVLRGFWRVFRNRKRLRQTGVLYAINPDNALLALFGRFCAGRRIPLVVEIADIQPAMLTNGFKGRLLRWIERIVLQKCQLLLTTSLGFLRNYFTVVQRYDGPSLLLENKVFPSTALIAARVENGEPVHRGEPWVIGYFGVFRCERSLHIIREVAQKLKGRVKFVLRGLPSGIDEGIFREVINSSPHISFEGPYRYPDDLGSMYSGVDLNWCFDFSATGGNSDWLLPNRIYEGGLFHCPALVLSGTETAEWVKSKSLGWIFSANLADEIINFIENLSHGEWFSIKQAYRSAPDAVFAGEEDYRRLSAELEQLALRSRES